VVAAAGWGAGIVVGVCEPGTIVLRIDGTLVISHSKKDRAAGTFKRTFGHHPLACWIDNTGELASLMLRAGNAGSNTAADLIAVLAEAMAQVPKPYLRKLLVTCDSAGASHELVDWLIRQNHARDRRIGFSIGFDIDADVRAAITTLRADCWVPALDNTTGAVRDDADVADITNLMRPRVQRCGWPKSLTFTVRRTKLAPGEQPTLFTLNGYKYSCFVTSKTSLTVQKRDARHRVHARVEDRYAPQRTPAWTTCPRNHGTSISAGATPSPSQPTSSHGSGCSAATASWPQPNPRPCATGCSPPQPASPEANAYAGSAYPPTGPGQPLSSPLPTRSAPCPCPHPDNQRYHRPDDQEDPRRPRYRRDSRRSLTSARRIDRQTSTIAHRIGRRARPDEESGSGSGPALTTPST
jgi:hypothetical protein